MIKTWDVVQGQPQWCLGQTESLETDPNIHSQLIFDKGAGKANWERIIFAIISAGVTK